MQKLVKGATKPKATAPKAKYVEPILSTTYEGGHDFDIVMDSLSKVIGSRNGSWPSIYKALIVLHIMIREGHGDITLEYIARHPRMLDIEDHIHRAPAMGRYARYLATRGQQFKETKIDHVKYKTKQGFTRLHSLSISKGLMRECDSVLLQLEALMRCQYQEQDIVNDDVLLMAFRLLVHDALSLFQVLNEGVINLLEHFFELPKPEAEQALDIYRGFRRITSKAISFLRTAKELEFKTMLHVPNIKHAPTSLVSSLEMYLNDPEFENNHRQYLSEKQAHTVARSKSQTKSDSKQISHPAADNVTSSNQIQQQPIQSQGPLNTAQLSAVQQQIHQVQPQEMATYDSNVAANPFWQSQQEASNIQAADGQAQMHMQHLRQLQMQQIEQQVLVRQQIQQLEQQKIAQQPFQQNMQHFDNGNSGFDFGLQPTVATQFIPQNQFEPIPNNVNLPAQQTQPQAQPLQPQSTEHNPFKRLSLDGPTNTSSAIPMSSYNTGTNPFKAPSPNQSFAAQFSALDNVGNQMQPSLIEFGQPQTYQQTGTNPFR